MKQQLANAAAIESSQIAELASANRTVQLPSASPVHSLMQLPQQIGNQAFGQFIRAKLRISQPGDEHEQEADRVADQVMRMPDPAVSHSDSNSLTSLSAAPARVQRACSKCEEDDEVKTVHRQATAGSAHSEGLQPQAKGTAGPSAKTVGPPVKDVHPVAAQINNLSIGGEPLPESSRAFFEPRFGQDFSHVRVHQDRQAAESAREINALAYTAGNDIVFGAGQFAPETSNGRSLLAHELAHVRQNASSATGSLVKRFEGPEHQDFADVHLRNLLQFLQTDEGERWASRLGMNRQDLVTRIMNDPYYARRVIQTRPLVSSDPTGAQPLRLTPAEIISLMGDFYGSPEALANAPASETTRILGVMNRERTGTISGSEATLQYEEITGGRYLRLAARNDTHFARLNRQEWRRLHEQGIAEARRATGPDAETRFEWALFLDAAAGHFLTDAFAAGHLFAKDELMAAITLYLRANPVRMENPAMATYAGVIGFSGRMPQLVLKNIHDRMNHDGFEVTNARGMRWRTFGDNYLAGAQETQRVAALAIFLSRQQVFNVRGSATAAANSAEIEALMPSDETIVRATQQAIAYIPQAAREVENLIYRNRAVAPAQFGPVLGAIIESNISTIGHPGRERELTNMLDSARRTGVEAPIAPSFTIVSF